MNRGGSGNKRLGLQGVKRVLGHLREHPGPPKLGNGPMSETTVVGKQ